MFLKRSRSMNITATLVPCRRASASDCSSRALEGEAVGQAGQRVVVRQVVDARLGLLVLGDVGEDGDVVGDAVRLLAVPVGDGVDGHPLRVDLAVLAAIPDFAGPAAGIAQGFPHLPVEVGFVAAGGEQARVFAEDVHRIVAGDLGEGAIDRDHPVVRIADHDRRRAVLEHLLREQQFFLRLAPFADVGINGDKTAAGQRYAAHFEGGAVGEQAFVEVRARRAGTGQAFGDQHFRRFVGAVVATRCVETDHRIERGQAVGKEAVRVVEQAAELGVAGNHLQLLVVQHDAAGETVEQVLQDVVLALQIFFGQFAVGDVGVGGDEAEYAAVVEQRLALYQMGAPATIEFEAVGVEFERPFLARAHHLVDVARPVFATLGEEVGELLEGRILIDVFTREVENVEEAVVPYLQTQLVVDHADALRHVLQHRLQLLRLQTVLVLAALLFGDVLDGAGDAHRDAAAVAEQADVVVEMADFAIRHDRPVVEHLGFAAGPAVGDGALETLPVVGVQTGQEFAAEGAHVLGEQAHQLTGGFRPPQAVADQIPFPAADAADALRFVEADAGLDQFAVAAWQLFLLQAGDALVAPRGPAAEQPTGGQGRAEQRHCPAAAGQPAARLDGVGLGTGLGAG
jgi:hypothetical protein